MNEKLARIADVILALWWGWVLLRSLAAGRIGGEKGFKANRIQRPWHYVFWIFVLALMVVHFAGLAYVGQRLGG